MKKGVFAISVLLVLLLCGCGSKTTDNQQGPENAQQTVTEEKKRTQAEKVSEQLITYTDTLGTPRILYLATVKNTDSVPLEFGNVTIDVNGADNKLIKHLDNDSVYPRFIMPGEFGYICAECAQLDDSIVLEDVQSAEMHFGTRRADGYEKPDVTFTQLELKQGDYDLTVLGKVKSNEDIDDLSIAFPIFDENGTLQTVALAGIEGLSAGDERGFECSPIECDPETDFSKSTVEAIPYIF